MNTTQRFPRPNPRFAGATEFILIGVDAVVRGLNEGEVGLVVGGMSPCPPRHCGGRGLASLWA